MFDPRQGASRHREMPERLMAKLTTPIFIIGPARHGKSTVREIICRLLGEKGGSSSDVIYHAWALLTGEMEETLRALPKEKVRPLLVALGDWLTGGKPNAKGIRQNVENLNTNFPHHLLEDVDPEIIVGSGLCRPSASALIQYSLNKGVKVLDGIRRPDELTEFLSQSTEKPNVLWVEDPRMSRVVGDNFSIPKSFATHSILNDGNLEDLETSVIFFLRAINAS